MLLFKRSFQIAYLLFRIASICNIENLDLNNGYHYNLHAHTFYSDTNSHNTSYCFLFLHTS